MVLVFERHQQYTFAQWAGDGETRSTGGVRGGRGAPIPDGEPTYALVESHVVANVNDIAVPLEKMLAGSRSVQWANFYADSVALGRAENAAYVQAESLTFTLHLVPLGAGIDNAMQGNRVEAVISFAGDLALLLGPLAKIAEAGEALRAARALRVAGGAIQGTIALTRGGQGIYAFSQGDVAGGADTLARHFFCASWGRARTFLTR